VHTCDGATELIDSSIWLLQASVSRVAMSGMAFLAMEGVDDNTRTVGWLKMVILVPPMIVLGLC